jgi:hypothetical protein
LGFWPRIVVTALATAAVFAGGWQGVEDAGAGQAAAIAVASMAGLGVITLGAAWALRARGSDDADDAGGVSAVVSRSASGQAVGQAQGPVFGPGSDFSGATFTFGSAARPTAGEASPTVTSEAGRPSAMPTESGPAGHGSAPVSGGRVVVGEIPQEPTAFQDRPDLLEVLTSPGSGRVSVVFAVTGLRGVGKSQLAAACARQRLGEGWPVVAWINAEDREEVLAGYAQLAAGLGLAADAPDSAEAARRIRHWLEADGQRCLLVLDNAVSAEELRPFLPAAGHAQVIVTSSNASLAGLGKGVPVDVFTQDQATAFLAERTGLDDLPGALTLARGWGSCRWRWPRPGR